jgi:D-alanine-D-alanine ligase-like ATP-grasp enzyme
MIKLDHFATYLGPGPQADEPVVLVRCTLTDPAAFAPAAARLAEGTEWLRPPTADADPELAAAAFLASWARALLNRQEGRIVEAGAVRDEHGVTVFLGYHHPQASLQALALGAHLLTESARLDARAAQELTDGVLKNILPTQPDFQAAILIEYARRVGLPWRRAQVRKRFWHFGQGVRGAMMFESAPMEDSYLGAMIARDKAVSKKLFAELGAPVAASVVVVEEKNLGAAAAAVGYPCVAKPLDRGRSVGVTTYVRDAAELSAAFRTAARESRTGVMIERHVEGELVRLMVMRGRLWRAIRRNRPAAVGDGRSTIAQLLEALNRSRKAGGAGHPLVGDVPADEEFRAALRAQGLTPADIPAAGRRVRLRNIPLLATGAHYEDVTAELHPETRATAEALAQRFGIVACGLDFITEDPATSCHAQGAFLEINMTPGLRVPILAGVPADEVAKVTLGEKVGRVPSLLVVAPAHFEAELRRRIPDDPSLGWACGASAGLGSTRLSGHAPMTHAAAEIIFGHPHVRAVVIVATAAELAKHGLPADRCDQAIILADAGLPESWRAVVRRRCGDYTETDELDRVNQAIAALPRA